MELSADNAVDMFGRVHAKSCALRAYWPCAEDECDFCGECDCGATCRECGSFFWFKTHPDPEVRHNGPLKWLDPGETECRWCWTRRVK